LPGSISEYFDSSRSKLNPYNYSNTFVYGTFPLFLNKAVAEWLDKDPDGSTHWTADQLRGFLGLFGAHFKDANGNFTFDGSYNSNQVGRVLSAVFDCFTVLLAFELGRVIAGRRLGLLAAALFSLTVLDIQYSHFFGSETFLAFFTTAVIYFSVRILKYGSAWNYVWAGVAFGLALACKLSALPVVVVPGLATLARMWPQVEALYAELAGSPPPWRGAGFSPPRLDWGALLRPAGLGLLVLFCAGVTFRIFQPYAFNGPGFFDVFKVTLTRQDIFSLSGWRHLEVINPTNYFDFSPKFIADLSGLRNLQSGADYPPNMQWINRTPYLFPLRNMFFFGLGPGLAVAAFGGVGYALYRMVRAADLALGLPAVWSLLFFALVGGGFVPTMRYFILIYPSLALLGAVALLRLWDAAAAPVTWRGLPAKLGAGARRVAPYLARGAAAAAVLLTFLWAMAFTGVYRQEISRAAASRWIHANVPPGATLTSDEWDDGIPLNLPGLPPSSVYKGVQLKPYAQDSPQKVQELVAGLDKADYVIETSNRLYASIPRIPARYPSTTLYFKYLFDGTLGFEQVAQFHNYPRLFGIDIPDQWAEEAFTVYDHPLVTIWRKTPAYSHDKALALLNPNLAADAVTVTPGDAATNALRLRPADLQTQQQGGTWDDVFASSGPATSYPALFWLVVLELAAFAVTPLALQLFRRLPDRGYLLAKPLGLLLLAYPVWLIVSLKAVHYTQGTIAAWLVLLMLGGAALAVRFHEEVGRAFARHWRLFVVGEAAFLLAFFVFYEFRLINPDLWHPYRGGEKPMDLAYLTAVTRSTTLPPYDPWFAGGYINYYYLGQFFTATLSKLTGIVPEVAFNLAVPTFFALTVAGAFSVSYNLAALGRRLLRRSPNGRPIPAWSPFAAAFLGVAFVAVVGNLDGVGEMVARLSAVSPWHVTSKVPLVAPVANSLGGLWQVVAHGAHLQTFDYWRPSRMMPPTISITEFPYFSFLFADLHAHMMAIPFDVLAIGGAAGVALNRRGERTALFEWLLIALLGLIVGGLRWQNSWDYPPFLLLAVAAVVIGERRAEGGLSNAAARVALKTGLLVAVSFAAYEPFLHNYTSPVSGVHRSPETTPLHQYLAHFGVFLAAVGAWLAWQTARSLRGSLAARLARLWLREGYGAARAAYQAMPARDQVLVNAAVTAAATVLALAAAMVFRDRTTIAAMVVVLPVVALLAGRELLDARADGGLRLFVLALLGLAFGLSLGVDVVTINGDIQRMNTVFKFYLHIWLLLGIAASYAVWYLAFVVWRPRLRPFGRRATAAAEAGSGASPWKTAPRYAVGGLLALLVAGAAVYPVAATPARLDERFVALPKTLDGTAYMRAAVYQDPKGPINLDDDYLGIQWLRHNVKGTPVIMEASLQDLYRWGSRFSIYTGLPDVMGWDWHQKQQRGQFGGPVIDKRVQQVRRFYEDPDPKQALATLSEYDVKYVIVGQVEKLYYNNAGFAKFENGLGGALEVAYRNDSLTIYRVALDPEALALAALK